MTASALKKEIQKVIENINDTHLLEAVYTVLNNTVSNSFEISKRDMYIVEARKKKYKNGQLKTYTVAEAKKKILKNLRK